MVLLDTDILVGYLRGDEKASKEIETFSAKGQELKVSAVTAMELMHGAKLNPDADKKLKDVNTLLGRIKVIPFELKAADHGSTILTLLKKKGSMIGLPDIQIGATALALQDSIVTRNIKDFSRIPGLRIHRW